MYVTPAITYVDDDKERAADDVIGGQIGVGWKLSPRVFVEGVLGYADMPGFFQDIEIVDFSANVLFSLGPDTRLSPYVLAGTGIMRTSSNMVETETSALANLGIGVMYRFGESPASLRLEYRKRFELYNTVTFDDQIVSLGIQYSFGKKAEPYVAPVWRDGDNDNDGIMNSADVCPNTPVGQSVNARGCPRDSDFDGVGDDDDQCPNTARGAIVNAVGCSDDQDVDGYKNAVDECLETNLGARVDVGGCQILAVIDLPSVKFETGSDTIVDGYQIELNRAAASLVAHPEYIVEVAGYTDSSGVYAANQALSEVRAIRVREYLVSQGVNPDSITARGYGEAGPVADNRTPEGREQNRRVEIRILSH
jgi:OOP family OmpA-OmpF porin